MALVSDNLAIYSPPRKIAVLGAGPHGRQVAHDLGIDLLYDDRHAGWAIDSWTGDYVAGALWPSVRMQIVAKAKGTPWRNGIYKAPSAIVGIETKAGEHVHILAGAIVSHGCVLDDFVTVATGARLCGEVHVGEGAFIGAGAIIVHGGIEIGAGAFIGAGMVILHDVPPGLRVTKSYKS